MVLADDLHSISGVIGVLLGCYRGDSAAFLSCFYFLIIWYYLVICLEFCLWRGLYCLIWRLERVHKGGCVVGGRRGSGDHPLAIFRRVILVCT